MHRYTHSATIAYYTLHYTTLYTTHGLAIRHRSLPKEKKNGSRIFQITQHTLKPSETTHILIHTQLERSTECSITHTWRARLSRIKAECYNVSVLFWKHARVTLNTEQTRKHSIHCCFNAEKGCKCKTYCDVWSVVMTGAGEFDPNEEVEGGRLSQWVWPMLIPVHITD